MVGSQIVSNLATNGHNDGHNQMRKSRHYPHLDENKKKALTGAKHPVEVGTNCAISALLYTTVIICLQRMTGAQANVLMTHRKVHIYIVSSRL